MAQISIVTVTYNNAEKLRANIDSVLSQSFCNIEHIIVDNLSRDDTESLVKEYKNKADYPVIYIREKDNGIYNAMNKGIQASSGVWVHTLNSDDYYYSEKSLSSLNTEDNEGYDVIANAILTKNEKTGSIISKWVPDYNKEINHYNFPHSGMVIKKDFYEKYGYYNEKYRILSDAMYCMKFLPFAKYKIYEEPLVVMLDSGISNKFSFTKSRELMIFTLCYYKGPLKYRIKFIIKNLFMDIKSIFKIFFKKLISFKKLII
ncbi:MAG: glycosyltransferase [Candidatus Humimicrobiaceae bacterium]